MNRKRTPLHRFESRIGDLIGLADEVLTREPGWGIPEPIARYRWRRLRRGLVILRAEGPALARELAPYLSSVEDRRTPAGRLSA